MSVRSLLAAVRDFFFDVPKAAPEGALVALMKRAGISPRRGTAQLLESFRTNPWARAVVGRIASEVSAATKWTLYDKPDRDPNRKQIFDHEVLDLLDDPNIRSGLDAQVVWAVSQASLDLVGDAFLTMDRDKRGRVVELTPVPVVDVEHTPDVAQPYFVVNYASGGAKRIEPADMIWLKDADPANPFGRGVGTAEAAGNELDIDDEATKQIKAFFRNGMLPGTMVTLEGAGDDEVDRFETFLKSKYLGSSNRNQTHITNRKIDVKVLETSFRDMQLVPLRKDQRDRFVQVYGVPPELFGILDSSNRATIDAAYYLFAKAVMVPRLRLLRSQLQKKLVVPEFGTGLFLGVESPVPEDRDFFIRCVAVAPAVATVNEVRSKMGLPPNLEWGDERLAVNPATSTPTQLPPAKLLELEQIREDLDSGSSAVRLAAVNRAIKLLAA